MTTESLPFFDTANAATKHALEAAGKGFKEAGKALWPDKSVEAAATALRNALNDNRDERLTAEQHIFLANWCGRFDWLYWCANECNHSRPGPIAPMDVHAELQRRFIDAVALQRQLLERMEANAPRVRAS